MNISDVKNYLNPYFESIRSHIPTAQTITKIAATGAILAAGAYSIGNYYPIYRHVVSNQPSIHKDANASFLEYSFIRDCTDLRPLAASVVNATCSLFESFTNSEIIKTTMNISETTSPVVNEIQKSLLPHELWTELTETISTLPYVMFFSALGLGLLPFICSRSSKKTKSPGNSQSGVNDTSSNVSSNKKHNINPKDENLAGQYNAPKLSPRAETELTRGSEESKGDFDEKMQIPPYLDPDPEFTSVIAPLNPETIGNPNTSKIHLIGDIHNNLSLLRAQQALLRKMSREGDVVLVESNQQLVMLNQKKISWTKELPQNVWVMGWDDLKSVIEANRITKELVESAEILKKPSTFPLTLEIATRHMGKLLKKMNRYDLVSRNRSLEKTVRQVRSLLPEKRIFLIAGQNHLNGELVETISKQTQEEPCLILFNPPKEEEKGQTHLDQIITETSPSALKIDHLLNLYPSGPCSLRKPRRLREDVKNIFIAKQGNM